jgi:type I restriction-modification system DNA methylase subunit
MSAVKKSTKPRNKKLTRMKPEDVQSILYELDAWEQGERGKKLTWDILERLSGFSRQSLWARSEIKNRFESVKETLRQGIDKNDSNQYRRTLEQRIDSLEKEINQLKQQQNHWLELWARYEYNAKVIGIDTSRLEQPLPSLNRN